MNQLPQIGAQVWIEPGTTTAQIDSWMDLLARHDMPVARVWIFWNHIEKQPDVWDFSLCDAAFESASRHGIRILATLTPGNLPVHRGGLPLIQNDVTISTRQHLDFAKDYVRQVVAHYKDHPALDTWILMNEPGMRPRVDELSTGHFREWLKKQYTGIDALNASWHTPYRDFEDVVFDERLMALSWSWPAAYLDWYEFWRIHQAEQLGLWSDIIREHDTTHGLHVNPHGLIANMATLSNDLPAWRKFLTSLGASIHPAWHFWMLDRNRYALGVSYVCELIRGASEPQPFWVTELQGGNNIYTTPRPMCPDADDIAQSVWTSVGAGAQRIVFWMLNLRTHSLEAGEWSMLDFQNKPTERLTVAGEIAGTLRKHSYFFTDARPVESPVTIILSLETMALQERYAANDSLGRGNNAHILEALGIYEALQEIGVPARIKHLHDFKWEEKPASPQLVILPNASALTRQQMEAIKGFVENGNTLLATGLTGFQDEHSNIWPGRKSPLASVFGGDFKEVRYVGNNRLLSMPDFGISLPVHLFISDIEHESGDVLSQKDNRIFALKNKFRKGETYWIPSLIGLGAWLGDRAPLATLLAGITSVFAENLPFTFESHFPGLVLRVLQNGKSFATIVINGGDSPVRYRLRSHLNLRPETVWGKATTYSPDDTITLNMRETVVLIWR